MADPDELNSVAKQLHELSTEPKLGSALEMAGRLLTDAVAGGAFSGTEYLRLRRLLDPALYKGARSPYPHIFFAVIKWFIENSDSLPAESRPDCLEGRFVQGETLARGYLSKNLPAVAQLIEREAARLREEVTPEQSAREAGSAVQEAETPEAVRVYGINCEGKLVLVPEAGDPNGPDAETVGDTSSVFGSSFQELHRAITARDLAQEEAEMEAGLIASLAESWPERPWGDPPGVATPKMEWISAIQRWVPEFDPRRPDWGVVRSVLILAPFDVRPADLTEYQVGDVATLLANRPAAPTGEGVADCDGREQPDYLIRGRDETKLAEPRGNRDSKDRRIPARASRGSKNAAVPHGHTLDRFPEFDPTSDDWVEQRKIKTPGMKTLRNRRSAGERSSDGLRGIDPHGACWAKVKRNSTIVCYYKPTIGHE